MIDNLAGYRIVFWKSISFWILILFLHCLTFRQCYGESSPRSFDSSHRLCDVVFPILLHSAETCGIFSLSPMFLKAKLQLDISVFWSNVLDTQWTFSIWQFRLSHFLGNFFPLPCFFFFFLSFWETYYLAVSLLRFMGSQRIGHNWVTEWTEPNWGNSIPDSLIVS